MHLLVSDYIDDFLNKFRINSIFFFAYQTGCGKKRSDNSITEEQSQPEEESVSEMLDINSEPAIEDLMRQIMSEAKLWEAIQEANKEISIQKSGKPHFRSGLAFSQQ